MDQSLYSGICAALWSLVKIGTTASQKNFFNLRRIKGQIGAIDRGDLKPEDVSHIADELNVSEKDVISMNQRMSGGDKSLNSPMVNAPGAEGAEWQDWLEDERPDQEANFAETEELNKRQALMQDAMQGLNSREIRIIEARRLSEPPLTLEELASEFSVSRERIRQIEVRAFEKLSQAVLAKANELKLLPSTED